MRFAQPSIHWATEAQSSGTNKLACETDHSPLSLVSRLGMSGAIRTLPYILSWRVQGKLHFRRMLTSQNDCQSGR